MLNYKEVELLLNEIPFIDSYIQDIREKDYHSFTLSFFNKREKAYSVYFEIATQNSHFSLTERQRKKSGTMQRFTQFLKAKIIGARILDVHQLNWDRAFYFKLLKDERIFFILFRFYSGPGANVIVYDESGKIEEVMFRRPKRGEISGELLNLGERVAPPEKEFEVREHPVDISFNEYIDSYYENKSRAESMDELREDVLRSRDREINEIERNIKRAEEKIRSTQNYEENKRIADLLSSNLYQVRKGMRNIEVTDYSKEEKTTISLREDLSPRENLERYYKSYQKDKRSHELALEELDSEKLRLEERTRYYERLLESDDMRKLREASADTKKRESEGRRYHGPSFIDSGYTLIVGRNSKENDEILRHDARGNDMWVHVRDYSGGYVIIKTQKGKDIPFNIILDAAHLALHYSKAKDEKSADLYYTYVKYLRRAKDAKKGLVLPTQEKNLFLKVEEERMRRVLSLKVD